MIDRIEPYVPADADVYACAVFAVSQRFGITLIDAAARLSEIEWIPLELPELTGAHNDD